MFRAARETQKVCQSAIHNFSDSCLMMIFHLSPFLTSVVLSITFADSKNLSKYSQNLAKVLLFKKIRTGDIMRHSPLSNPLHHGSS